MFLFGCCQDTRPTTQICRQSATYFEFSSSAQTQPILLPSIPNQPVPQYPNTRRVKVKYRDVEKLTKELRASGMSNFVDDDFPHRVSSLGKNYERPVIWLRIRDVVKDPVYCLQSTIQDWQRFRCSNKCLQSALYLLRKHHPQLLMRLLSKQLNEFGMYQFRVMIDGIITEQIIDDYIPCSQGMPVYAKPFKINQVFPILIEKALAKVFGSYIEIPECPLGIMETLAGTPVMMWTLKPKVYQEQLIEMKNRIDVGATTTCFMPRQGSLLGEQGLVEGEPYLLVSFHQVLYNNKPIVLYELTNLESKSDWNGPFHEFDEKNWGMVKPEQAFALKQRIRTNGCFMVQESDVLKYFSIMSSIEKTDTRCLDWTKISINQHHGTFMTLNIRAPVEKIFIKTWACQAVRQVLLLGRLKKNNEYQFVQGSMLESAKNNYIKAELVTGVYVLFIKVEWQARETNEICLGSCSSQPLQLIPASKAQYPEMLTMMFKRLAFGANPSKPNITTQNYNVYLFYRKMGYAFVLLKADQNSPTVFTINQHYLLQQGFKLRKPYRGRPTIEVGAGQTLVITLKMLNNKSEGEVLTFPQDSIRVQK